MKKITILLICVSLLVSLGCSNGTPNPRSYVITPKNIGPLLSITDPPELSSKESFDEKFNRICAQEIEGFNKLSLGEKHLFGGFIILYSIISGIPGIDKNHPVTKFGLVGRTVREIIEFQRQWEKERREDGDE